MSTKPPTQEEIAAELGVSGAAVSKLKARGMPTHSADAARAWRAAHLHPGRRRNDPGPSPRTLAERAQALVPVASAALKAGRFGLVVDELRAALRAVPTSHRDWVRCEPELWDALIGAEALQCLAGDPSAPLSDDEASYVGAVCFELASGEMAVRRGGPRRG